MENLTTWILSRWRNHIINDYVDVRYLVLSRAEQSERFIDWVIKKNTGAIIN